MIAKSIITGEPIVIDYGTFTVKGRTGFPSDDKLEDDMRFQIAYRQKLVADGMCCAESYIAWLNTMKLGDEINLAVAKVAAAKYDPNTMFPGCVAWKEPK
jgi:hypothetical protein